MGQVVPLHSIPGDFFTWDKGIGVIEDSTLVANDFTTFTSHLVVRSHKTGEFKTFYFTNEILNEDGDTESWIYESRDGVQVHILND